jgi:hypothetical protein
MRENCRLSTNLPSDNFYWEWLDYSAVIFVLRYNDLCVPWEISCHSTSGMTYLRTLHLTDKAKRFRLSFFTASNISIDCTWAYNIMLYLSHENATSVHQWQLTDSIWLKESSGYYSHAFGTMNFWYSLVYMHVSKGPGILYFRSVNKREKRETLFPFTGETRKSLFILAKFYVKSCSTILRTNFV